VNFETEPLISRTGELDFSESYFDLSRSLTGLSEEKIELYFNAHAMGARNKSLASTVRSLILNDLQLKGWEIGWQPFKGHPEYEGAVWNFDAALKVETSSGSGFATLEISFDNRVALGTHLVKSSVANNLAYRDQDKTLVRHHCIIAASKAFKDAAGIDNSVASAEEFRSAAKIYDSVASTSVTLVSLKSLETIEILQTRFSGRTKSGLFNRSAS
jgi:hypothetical protein